MKVSAISSPCLLLGVVVAQSFGQGTLFPPGDPAPTMKTLEQIEPRTIVNAANTPGDATSLFVIRNPGSYYLAGNLTGEPGKHGISIQAADVTLDLNGFAVIGNDGSTHNGVEVSATATSFCTRNGSVRNWNVGVNASGAGALVEKLRLHSNQTGLSVSNGANVRDTIATGNHTGFISGDRSQMSNCVATENQGCGFLCTSFVNLIDCTSNRNGSFGFRVNDSCILNRCTACRNYDNGIKSGDGCSIIACTASNNAGAGIEANGGGTIVNCTASSNSASGFFIGPEGTIRGCTARANLVDGITGSGGSSFIADNSCTHNRVGMGVFGDGNRVEGNVCNTNSFIGFSIVGSKNLVTRNSAGGNGTDYQFASANTSIAIDLRAGVSDANTPPWANIIH